MCIYIYIYISPIRTPAPPCSSWSESLPPVVPGQRAPGFGSPNESIEINHLDISIDLHGPKIQKKHILLHPL